MAHHIHNLLFLLGPEIDRSAEPKDVDARVTRVNDIETFDSVAARIGTDSGVELLFLASHTIALEEALDPRFRLDFENASVEFKGGMGPITAQFDEGELVEYASPDATSQVAKLWLSVNAVHHAVAIPCVLETARPHTAFIEAVDRSMGTPHGFPERAIRISETDGGRLRWVEGMADVFRESYETGDWPKLPGDGS
jgi:hypothetical protein